MALKSIGASRLKLDQIMVDVDSKQDGMEDTDNGKWGPNGRQQAHPQSKLNP